MATSAGLSGTISVPPRGEPGHGEALAHRALDVLRRLARASRNMQIRDAEHFEFLFRAQAHRQFGCTSFEDFAREELQTSARTSRRHLVLHRILSKCPLIAEAIRDGKIDPSHALVLKPVLDLEDLKSWIELASCRSVAELQAAVSQYLADHDGVLPSDVDYEETGQRVTFAAPRSVLLVWDHGIELARRMLGWEAPTHICLDAILSEASSQLSGREPSELPETRAESSITFNQRPSQGEGTAFPKSGRVVSNACSCSGGEERSEVPGAGLPEDLDDLQNSVAAALHLLSELTQRTGPPADVQQSMLLLRTSECDQRRLRLALVRVLRDLDVRMIRYLGYDSASSLLTQELKLSGRTAQRLRAEGWLFEDNMPLKQAYETGQVGLGQAYLIERVANRTTLSAFISRASSVTHLYFEREIRFRERLEAYAPWLARKFPGPLPWPGLEETLRERFLELRSPDSTLGEQFLELSKGETSHGQDPAQNASTLPRLEGLLELLVLAEEEKKGNASGATAPTLAGHDSLTTISFWAPKSIIDLWEHSLAHLKERNGPLPTWALASLLMEAVVNEWCNVDQRSRSNHSIHGRDGWRCQAPGCSSRRHLEIHHIIFKSRGGSDDPDNLVTICHGHHRMIHDEIVDLSGRAPSDLFWDMGRAGLWHGNKRLSGKHLCHD